MSAASSNSKTYACHIDSLIDRFLQHVQTQYPQVDQLGDDIYAKFSYLIASMPTGLTRNDTHIHTLMLKILNSITDWRRHSPLANHRLTSLWGWPGDDLTYEFDQLSVDISYNFNRMNKVQWKIQAVQSALQEESSDSLSVASSSSEEDEPLDMDSISPLVSLDPSSESLPVNGMGIST
jgi:hypothetical protein